MEPNQSFSISDCITPTDDLSYATEFVVQLEDFAVSDVRWKKKSIDEFLLVFFSNVHRTLAAIGYLPNRIDSLTKKREHASLIFDVYQQRFHHEPESLNCNDQHQSSK